MNFLVFLLCFCLLLPPLSPLSIPLAKAIGAQNSKPAETEVEQPVEPIEQVQEPVDETPKITLNNTLDLDGYATIRIPSSYYSILEDDSTFTKKVIRYKDKRSKITISYITGLTDDADIPGYITRELAGLDIVTNSKHEVEYESGTWMVIPADKVIDGAYPTVYYKTSKDETTAIWMRVNRNENMLDTDLEEFDNVLTAILNSYNMYYSSGTVFDTPTTGYYAENPVDGQDTVGDTTSYKENDQDNNVFNTGQEGFDFSANIAMTWHSLEIMIDGQKLKLPCTLDDLTNAGLKANDSSIKYSEYYIGQGNKESLQFQNENGTTVLFTFFNDSNTEIKELSQCSVIALDIDTSKFITTVTSDNNEEENTDTEAEEDSENEDDGFWDDSINFGQREDEPKEFDNISANHVIILPCGMMNNVYTTDILEYYGDPSDIQYVNGSVVYKWRKNEKSLTLECGVVKNIKHITMNAMEN